VIEAKLSLASEQASNHRRSSEWSFYTASVSASSNSALEVWAHLRWKNFGRDSVPSAGNWRATVEECASRGMAVTAVRSVV
jgi:hypothetical protein